MEIIPLLKNEKKWVRGHDYRFQVTFESIQISKWMRKSWVGRLIIRKGQNPPPGFAEDGPAQTLSAAWRQLLITALGVLELDKGTVCQASSHTS